MDTSDLTTFLSAQTTIVAGVFLAGFGAVYGISLIRAAITKHSRKLKQQV